eukprot:TRINITY_DN84_c0_g1_i2.p2 TRINITY_DN84_c0_g1~~TRINITY_DN84_c0_g1_i2.p2  ORF type:complete len:154 (+),score=61.76 TRINITY_DN84_c0_g1_i2:25-462(+)
MSIDRKQAEEVFTLFDTTGAGSIPSTSLVWALGAFGLNPTGLEINEMLESVGHPDTLDFESFCTFAGKNAQVKRSGEECFTEAFRVFDKEQNGKLMVSELRQCLMNLGDKITGDEVDELLRVVQDKIDDEGFLNYSEIVKLICAK